MKRIDYNEALEIIKAEGLQPLFGIHHYSFNFEFQKSDKAFLFRKKSLINIGFEPFNNHSPAWVFSNNILGDCNLKILNAPIKQFTRIKNYNKLFWHLKLTDFNSFLERKDLISSNPKKHYPSTQTYNNIAQKLSYKMEFEKLDSNKFIERYDALRPSEFMTGEEIISSLYANNQGIPENYFKMASLSASDQIVAVALLVDDGQSLSLINITSARSKWSYGVILCTEIIKIACSNHYISFDAGVSGNYGSYKQKIFLDSMDVCLPTPLSFIERIKEKIKKILLPA